MASAVCYTIRDLIRETNYTDEAISTEGGNFPVRLDR